jgi:hypothetical protein
MSEPILPFPTDHVFGLQLQESHGRAGNCRAGGVEHLSSGEAMSFAKARARGIPFIMTEYNIE